ncbi:hypothetical protein [Terrabacter aerolatus]|nr:hypothetical protein [Terrabacter aerolatus]
MTTSTLIPARPGGTATADTAYEAYAVSPTSATEVASPTRAVVDRVPLLALLAPLVLFTHGIVSWVDGLDSLDDTGVLGGLGGLEAAREEGALSVAAGILLVASVSGFAWLTVALGARLRYLPLALPTAVLAAFGAGATGAVWVGHVTGLLGDTVPAALSSGGAVLTGVALAVVLVALAVEGRLPVGSVVVAAVAAGVLLLPWGLEPLGAVLLLIASGPLTRQPEVG